MSSVLANAALLERSEVQSRVLSVLQSKSFVDSSKLNPSSSFFYDLGLDELHAAEIRQSLSAEFCVFVPEVPSIFIFMRIAFLFHFSQ